MSSKGGLTVLVLAFIVGGLSVACGSNLSQRSTSAPVMTAAPPATSKEAPPTPTATITPTPGPPQTIAVTISDTGFTPPAITVRVGDTVTWTNNGPSIHWIVADMGSFDSGNLSVGQTFSHTFQKPGAFAYHCEIYAYLKGVVYVQ